MKRKHALTLIEIMIVIAIISLIGAVVGFNMNKVLHKGKLFRTHRAIEQVHDILMLESIENGIPLNEIVDDWIGIVQRSGYGQNENSLLTDGWGAPLIVRLKKDRKDIDVLSENLKKGDAP